MPANNVILTISCPDRVGLISAVSGFLAENQAFIHESAQYGDPESKIFFMRCVFSLRKGESRTELEKKFEPFAKNLKMTWRMHDGETKPKVVILVSKFGHCLNDLLHRYHSGTLPIEIPAVISNHGDFKSLVDWHKIPFHLVPADKGKKHEAQIRKVLDETKPDLVVLARYMQILSPELCKSLSGKCINIHHSFLPSFKGAKPYAQAFKRGVKLIGATAHYVTDDLDEGPIIDQAVERVDHTFGPAELTAVGRDIENIVLSRAVRYHIEHRILLNQHKTVVFR
jgi:formyltetrahydrofolate deformylase